MHFAKSAPRVGFFPSGAANTMKVTAGFAAGHSGGDRMVRFKVIKGSHLLLGAAVVLLALVVAR